MPSNPIQGTASVSPVAPPLPPAKAVWTVNAEEKTATTVIFGGAATIYRSPKDNKFRCDFALKHEAEVDGERSEGEVKMTIPLHNCPNLEAAKVRAEMMIRENLSKTHPALYQALTKAEQSATIDNAPADPF